MGAPTSQTRSRRRRRASGAKKSSKTEAKTALNASETLADSAAETGPIPTDSTLDTPSASAADSVAERTGSKAILAGGTMLALATMAAAAGNYVLNILLGRWLGAGDFSDVNLMVTLMLLVTAIAISVQLIASRFAGQHHVTGSDDEADRLARWLEKRSIAAGVALAAILVVGAPVWSDFFRTESAWPFVILGVGMPFYLAQGVGRGVLQGRLKFAALAMTYVVEMVVRLGVSVLLVVLGFGVSGATFGLSVSFVATWLAVRRAEGKRAPGAAPVDQLRSVITYTGPVAVLLVGQIIINNGDVLIVKRFFEPELAGAYAGVALIGRAVFFLSWSIVTTIFPATTQRDEAGSDSAGLVAAGMGAITLIGAVSVGAAVIAGESAMRQVFGDEYTVVASYLPWYAFATSLFALANLMASYDLSIGRSTGPRLLIVGAVVQSTLLIAMSGELAGIIRAQVISMAALAALCFAVVGPRALGLTQRRSRSTVTNTSDAVHSESMERTT